LVFNALIHPERLGIWEKEQDFRKDTVDFEYELGEERQDGLLDAIFWRLVSGYSPLLIKYYWVFYIISLFYFSHKFWRCYISEKSCSMCLIQTLERI
jgi:hypothetical protein